MAARRDGTTAALLNLHDLAVLLKLPVSTAVAWCLPERWWGIATGRVADLLPATRRTGTPSEQRGIETLFEGHPVALSPDRILAGYTANVRRDQLHFMRSHTRRGWHPRVDLVGGEHLDAALGRGRGAILWVAPFVFSYLVTKMALREAGYELGQLSRIAHGYSASRFGIRVLNPIRTRIENRYLAERVVIGSDGMVAGPLARLTERLQANGIVAITVGAAGSRPYRCACLNARLEIARGAPNLMVRTGAVLLPVFTVRSAEGHFVTTIEHPLEAPQGTGRDQVPERVIERLVKRLEPYLLRWPDQFNWRIDLGRALTAAAPD